MKSEILNVGRAHVCARATFDRNRGTLIRFPAGLRAFVPRDPRILWMFINANNTGEFNGTAWTISTVDSIRLHWFESSKRVWLREYIKRREIACAAGRKFRGSVGNTIGYYRMLWNRSIRRIKFHKNDQDDFRYKYVIVTCYNVTNILQL